MVMFSVIKLLILAFSVMAVIFIIALFAKHGKKILPGLLVAGGVFVVLIFVMRFFSLTMSPRISETANTVPRLGVFPILFLPLILVLVAVIMAYNRRLDSWKGGSSSKP